jgi:hypothetical protein
MQTYSLILREKHLSSLCETVEGYLDFNERQLAGKCGEVHLHRLHGDLLNSFETEINLK